MRLVIPYSSGDIAGALRLVKWIGFLSSRYANSMQFESVVLVASPRAARMAVHAEIGKLATAIFGECTVYVPPAEKEIGWPGSANWMFETALEYVEKTFSDAMLWMEPDAVPLCPNWYDFIKHAWAQAQAEGKHFLGARVPYAIPHMSGIAVYGEEWRAVAPSLVTCPDEEAFDVHSADEVLPLAKFTPLIQHVFHRHDKGWRVPGLSILDERAVVFHQDKLGILIGLIDRVSFNGDCLANPIFKYQFETINVMRKFYRTANATKAVQISSKRIAFAPLPAFAGAVPGEYSTESEAEQVELDDLAQNPTTGITVLTKEQWETVTKKKAPVSATTTSAPSKIISPSLPLAPTPSRQPAALVAEPQKSVGEVHGKPGGPIKDIDDVLKVETVIPSQPNNAGPRKGKAKKPTPA